MALTLVVEDGTGLSTANSYCSLADADAYHERRLHSQVWRQVADPASQDQKKAALVWATRLLDEQCDWLGSRSTLTQALGWPRRDVLGRFGDEFYDSDEVPQVVKEATAELARLLIEEDRPRKSEESMNLTSKSASGKSKSYGPRDNRRGAFLPPSVLSLLGPFTRTRSSFRVVRV